MPIVGRKHHLVEIFRFQLSTLVVQGQCLPKSFMSLQRTGRSRKWSVGHGACLRNSAHDRQKRRRVGETSGGLYLALPGTATSTEICLTARFFVRRSQSSGHQGNATNAAQWLWTRSSVEQIRRKYPIDGFADTNCLSRKRGHDSSPAPIELGCQRTGYGFRAAPKPLGEALLEDCALHAAGRLMLDGWQGGNRAHFCIIDFALEASRAQALGVNVPGLTVRRAARAICLPREAGRSGSFEFCRDARCRSRIRPRLDRSRRS